MIQDNKRYTNKRDLCKNTIKQIIIGYLEKQELPKSSEETWDTLLSKSFNKKDYYFLKLMLKSEVHEESIYINDSIKGAEIEQKCSGGIIPEEVIHFSKVKVALILKHIRFILDAMDAYGQIIATYNNLPKKTHITQQIVDEELSNSVLLTEINASLLGEESKCKKLKEYKDNFLDEDEYPHLENAKTQGISLKEFKKAYPLYRSHFKVDAEFTYCIEVYSYYFFLNHFTYDSQEKAAEFAYSTIEYIRSITNQSKYTLHALSYYGSLLDKISKLKENLPYSLEHEDVIQCDINISRGDFHIGIHFPRLNTVYTEYSN